MPQDQPRQRFATPKTDCDRVTWLQLIRSRRVGPATFQRLMNEYGSADNALAALPEIAQTAGVARYSVCSFDRAAAEYNAGLKSGATLLCLGQAPYPTALSEISDSPPALWALGDISLLSRPCVALVGARNASSIGSRMAQLLARELGELGIVVVSGLARGIDASAHSSALAFGTIAVQASGVDVIYPAENTTLAHEIARTGLRLSEQPLGLQPQARHFPRRNRIISGISQGIVVVEGAAKSGSLITARMALDQGREVMAVPGNPLDPRASGCNMLIRDGARLVRSGADIVEALSLSQQPDLPFSSHLTEINTPKPPQRKSGLKSLILSLLSPTAVSEDRVIRETGQPAQQVSSRIQELEISGQIERHPGGLLSLSARN